MAAINFTTYADIGRRLREIPLDTHISSYEWEELVYKMCASQDSALREMGTRELNSLRIKQSIRVGM
jgi:hypothetical protein